MYMSYSIFEYSYRDAANYKAWGRLLLSGQVTSEQINLLSSCLDSGEFFIAEQVGIPPLYKQLWKFSDGPTPDDHVWHTFHTIRPATYEDVESLPYWGHADKILSNLCTVTKWNLALSRHFECELFE